MDRIRHLQRVYEYDIWATREALASLQAIESSPSRSLAFMNHIIGTKWLWMDRLQDTQSGVPVWPDWTLDQCEAKRAAIVPRWQAYIDALTPDTLADRISYRNSKGELWESVIGDVVTHIIMHSMYHRGQIAAELRTSGHTPAITDFIHATRQGIIE